MNVEKILAGITLVLIGIWSAKTHINSLIHGKSDTLGGHISLVCGGIVFVISGIIILIKSI